MSRNSSKQLSLVDDSPDPCTPSAMADNIMRDIETLQTAIESLMRIHKRLIDLPQGTYLFEPYSKLNVYSGLQYKSIL